MMQIRRSADRGHANHGWLDTYFTFSFADYHDPDHMGFGALRVINQDVIEPGKGFGTHGHQNMEIVTYLLSGTLEHRDSMGNGSQIRPGEVQLMSAGTGVTHSEFNASATDRVELLQMWVLPARQGTEPRYEQREFAAAGRRGRLQLVVAPDGRDGALTIGQDVRLYAGVLDAGETVEHRLEPGRRAWLHLARGSLGCNGEELGPGDGAALQDEATIRLEGRDSAELVLFDLS